MKRYFICLFCLLFCAGSYAQPYLKPSIGLASLPADNEPICNIPVYLGNYDTSGYAIGDTIADFTLYKTNGTPVHMQSVLQMHRPILLVAGSYTCGEFRSKVADINNMATFYSGLLNIIVVYTPEAHPNNDICPYTGTVFVGNQNIQDNIFYPQPTTYGERVAMVDTMNAHLTIIPPVVVDGPCNEWWTHFGPAPNNAYLVDTNGIVKGKAGWFDHPPENMWCTIDSFLGTNSGNCNNVAQNGTFAFDLIQDSVANGLPGDLLEVKGVLKNLSPIYGCTINIQRSQVNVPVGWATSLCTDICMPPTLDNMQVVLGPLDTQSFIFNFYTDPLIPGSGLGRVKFVNFYNSNNKVQQNYYGNTTEPLSIAGTGKTKDGIEIFPNPVNDILNVRFPETGKAKLVLSGIDGKVVKSSSCNYCETKTMDISSLKPGMYWLNVQGDKWNRNKKVIVH